LIKYLNKKNLNFLVFFRDINKVDDTMDNIREQIDMADEISNAISAPMIGFDIDDVYFILLYYYQIENIIYLLINEFFFYLG
jgi:hypothetical protein